MSSALFSNFISSDVLQETKLKPWFETVRGYLVFTNVLVSIYMVYDIKSDSLLNCVSANASVEFAASTTKYANSYCSAQLLQWYQRNFGIVCLLCCLAIYFSYCWWLLIPSVKESFALVRGCDDSLKELKGTPSDLKSIIQLYYSKKKPNTEFSDDEISKLIVVSHRLWCGHSGVTNIFQIYQKRNIGSLVILVIVDATLVYLFFFTINQVANPVNCPLDILKGAHAHCFIPAKDKIFPFVITILVVTSALMIGTLVLLLLIKNRSETSARQHMEKKWVEMGLSDSDLEKLHHGEDCNRFAEIFSESATPFSKSTKILMYFSEVINSKDLQHCSDRLLYFTDKMEHEKLLNVTVEGQDSQSNTDILNEVRALHGEVRNGKRIDEFLSKHQQTFNNRYQNSDQPIDNDNCQCKSLFARNIELDGSGNSFMWHAFSDLNGLYKQNLAAHLVLCSMDEAGNSQSSSRVTKSNRNLATSSIEFLDGERSAAELTETTRTQLNKVREIVQRFRPQVSWSLDGGPEDESVEQTHETTSLIN